MGSQKYIPHFFHKMPTSQKLIPQNTCFFMPKSQKFAEWNNHFCAAHKDDFLQVNKYIFQLIKYEHKDVREGIDSDDTNLSSNAMQLKAL